MTPEILLERARLLIQHNRPQQAIEQLAQLLALDPDSSEGHALMALCMTYDRDRWHDATREAEQAIHLAPDFGLAHYALAVVLEKRNRHADALVAVREAIRLEPSQPHFSGLAASLHAQQAQWQEALDVASQGMQVDPDDESCAAMRSLALERLGRTSDAVHEADAAVARNPDSAEAHSMRGWTQLQNGNYTQAQDSFREALRLNPNYEFARSGMIQALNSNHLLFRLVFRFYSFLGRMAQGAQWAIIIGLFVGMRILRQLGNQYPNLQPYITPISVLYLGFCLLSWIANPLFNTFLRFHPFGKFLLSKKQIWSSNLVALCLVAGVAGAVLQFVRGDYPSTFIMFIAPVFLTLPISTAFEVDEGWPMWVAIAASLGLGLLCILSLALITVDGPWSAPLGLYILGILIFSFAGNWLRNVTLKH